MKLVSAACPELPNCLTYPSVWDTHVGGRPTFANDAADELTAAQVTRATDCTEALIVLGRSFGRVVLFA